MQRKGTSNNYLKNKWSCSWCQQIHENVVYTYELWLCICKIVRSSVILLLPLFVFYFVTTFNTYMNTAVDNAAERHQQ
jgi:hypothetical protein